MMDSSKVRSSGVEKAAGRAGAAPYAEDDAMPVAALPRGQHSRE